MHFYSVEILGPREGRFMDPSSRLKRYGAIGFTLILLFLLLGFGINWGLVNSYDVTLFTAVNSNHNNVLDSVMIISSAYGREVVWGLLTLGFFVFGGKREKKIAIALGFTFIVLMGAGYIAKDFYSRQRPYDTLSGVRLIVNKEFDGSYPSGHTFIVAAGVIIAWLSMKRTWAVLLTVEAGFVAYSRIYIGVHYPSDIIGGVLLGAGFAFIICSHPYLVDRIFDALPNRIQGE
jgi:undecaprenyl-diphosphatase